jgi:hypothetical protein
MKVAIFLVAALLVVQTQGKGSSFSKFRLDSSFMVQVLHIQPSKATFLAENDKPRQNFAIPLPSAAINL